MQDHEKNARMLATAVGCLLKPNEGIVIDYEGVNYAVYRDGYHNVAITSEEDMPEIAELEGGHMLWMHDSEEEAEEAAKKTGGLTLVPSKGSETTH